MRKLILIAALGATGFTAAACSAQSTPQTAAQANAGVLAQTTPAPGTMPAPGMRGPRRGGGGGWMRADANHDGIVTRAEVVAEADQRFDAMDTNHDGQISAAEMQASREQMRERREARGGADMPPPPPGGPKHMPGMGRKADPDGSGTISRAEFEARATARFDRMDANHDGKLDKTELANMAEMRHLDRREARDGTMPPPPGGDTPPPPPGE